MNGAHDLGGMHGLGPINPERDEPVFHHEWQRRIFALTLASGAMGRWNIDTSRHARENQPPGQYLRNSYYQTWLVGLENLLLRTDLVTAEELAEGQSTAPLPQELAKRVLQADQVEEAMSRGSQYRMDDDVSAKFAIGDKVQVQNNHPADHTRAPRYVRGRSGTVERDHGVFVFADANARGPDNKIPQHIYSVCFGAQELWGPAAAASDRVCVDLWDDHLRMAG